jgi:hypothetical protein
MAGYIGARASVVSSGAERKQTYAITTTTTSLTGLAYTPTKVHVYHNGIRLVDGTDYTATDGSTITLTNAAQNGDEVVVISYATFQTSDTVSAANGGTFAGNVEHTGTLTASGAFTSLGIDDNATSTAMTLDSSGNLLVGTTDDNVANNSGTSNSGFNVRSSGRVLIAEPQNAGLWVNRLGNDGDIAVFRKDGSTVGSIVSRTGSNNIAINTADNSGRLSCSGTEKYGWNNTNFWSISDNTNDLGINTNRWDDIYATNGTIQTSDRNEKQDVAELDEAEKRVAVAAKGLIRKYRWIDAVQEKGDDARIHVGIIAQDLQAAFTAEGLDASRYAMFISSTWWEATETYTDDDGVEQTRVNTYETAEEAPEGATERTRLGVRYPELLAFIIGAL